MWPLQKNDWTFWCKIVIPFTLYIESDAIKRMLDVDKCQKMVSYKLENNKESVVWSITAFKQTLLDVIKLCQTNVWEKHIYQASKIKVKQLMKIVFVCVSMCYNFFSAVVLST
jgi:hypothetical protein